MVVWLSYCRMGDNVFVYTYRGDMFVNKNCSCLQMQILYASVKLTGPYSKRNEVNDKDVNLKLSSSSLFQ